MHCDGINVDMHMCVRGAYDMRECIVHFVRFRLVPFSRLTSLFGSSLIVPSLSERDPVEETLLTILYGSGAGHFPVIADSS